MSFHHPCRFVSLLLALIRAMVQRTPVDLAMTADWNASDWKQLVDSAHSHRLIPLAHRLLHDRPEVPEACRILLSKHQKRIALRNMLTTAELLEILKSLDDRDIPCIAFKGPVLAQQLYPGIEHRQYIDLDLIVPKQYVADINFVFQQRQYDRAQQFADSPRALRRMLRWYPETEFVRLQEGVPLRIDLHWSLSLGSSLYTTSTQAIFNHSEFLPLAGRKIRTMHVDDLLPFLAYHGCKHRWYRLSWLADFAKLVADLGPEKLSTLHARLPSNERRYVSATLLLIEKFGIAHPLSDSIPTNRKCLASLESIVGHIVSGINRDCTKTARHGIDNARYLHLLTGRPATLIDQSWRVLLPTQADILGGGVIAPYFRRLRRIVHKGMRNSKESVE